MLAFTFSASNDDSVNEEDVCQASRQHADDGWLQADRSISGRALCRHRSAAGGKSDVYMVGWANEPTLDAYSILVQVLSTRQGADGVANYGGWSYPGAGRNGQAGRAKQDQDKRLAMRPRRSRSPRMRRS